MKKTYKILVIVAIVCALPILCLAEGETPISPIKSGATAEDQPEELQVIASEEITPSDTQQQIAALPAAPTQDILTEETKYTLGPDDVVEIVVLRHPEFSGTFPVNKEGKIQYKFVGDLDVNNLSKQQLEAKIKEAISTYVISPEVNVTITEYRSKVFYVLGEVGSPGKYYMRAENLPVREAVFQAGLPTFSASMRKCRIISPDDSGRARVRSVDLYSLLYAGDLRKDINLFPGDVLYVPSTVMAKIIRVINPIASTIGIASSAPEGVSTGKEATKALVK
jgi:protein involved in polysaccharide export with SLBB domain